MNVTNGVVEYGRVTKPADYESKSAKVSLSFAVDDGADPAEVTAKVFDMAVAEVHRRLGLPVVGPTMGVNATLGLAKIGLEIEGTKKRRAKTPPAEVPVDPAAIEEAGVSELSMDPARYDAGGNLKDPAAIEEPADVPEAGSSALIWPTELWPFQPAVITDKDLHTGVHLAMERKVANAAIKALVAQFNGNVAGKSMTLIPAGVRQAFLDALKAL